MKKSKKAAWAALLAAALLCACGQQSAPGGPGSEQQLGERV